MATRRLPPLPTVKDILRMFNIKAQKRLSQNFLMDPRLLDRVARAGGALEGCHVVEVGPGPGGITRSILGQGATRLAAIEKDPRFLPSLHLLREASGDRLDIHLGDALSFNMANIFPHSLARDWTAEPPDIRVLGNLPFNVATPLIIRWLSNMSARDNIFSYGRVPLTLTFQAEVAERMVAPPGDKRRSRLSVMCQNWARLNYNFTIPGPAFVPKPEVNVGVVTFTPLVKPYIDLPFPMVERIITTIFHGKRKHLVNNLSALFPKPMAKRFSEQMIAESGLGGREYWKSLSVLDLDMASLEQVCLAYTRICRENPSLLQYSHRNTKHQALDQLVYEDGSLYSGEAGLAGTALPLGQDGLSSSPSGGRSLL